MDAVKLLTNDHRTVEELFSRYQSLGADAPDQKKEIVQEIIRELSIHASIEEQVLYPGIRDVLSDGDDLAEEALSEHQEVKELLSHLDRMDPSDSGFDAKVRSVIDDVRHHVGEEESEMFPKLMSAVPRERLDGLGERMEKAKKVAPTRPHPMAPSTPPGNLVAGPMAAAVDRARDAVMGRGKKSSTRKGTARKSGARKGSTRKSTGGRKSTSARSTRKTSGRKTSARKASSRKSTARKRTARKSTPRKRTASKSSARKGTTRKGTARKSTARKSTARKTTGRKSTGRKSTARKSTGRRGTPPKPTAKKRTGRKSSARRSS